MAATMSPHKRKNRIFYTPPERACGISYRFDRHLGLLIGGGISMGTVKLAKMTRNFMLGADNQAHIVVPQDQQVIGRYLDSERSHAELASSKSSPDVNCFAKHAWTPCCLRS